ncbi:hypothetical protein EMCRGX_G034308 [Ephydatia muelleri]|eukprot:Em0023g238a
MADLLQSGSNFDYSFKLALIGDSGVGKTCVLTRYTDNQFQPSFLSTIGIDFKVKMIRLNGKTIKLQIWDTAGQDRFRSITPAIYRDALGIFVLYDLTRRDSFDNVKVWLEDIEKYASSSGLEMMLVANKCDLHDLRAVTTAEGKRLAEEHKMTYVETSAESNLNITEAFEIMAKNIFAKSSSITQSQRTDTVVITPEDVTHNHKRKCCGRK